MGGNHTPSVQTENQNKKPFSLNKGLMPKYISNVSQTEPNRSEPIYSTTGVAAVRSVQRLPWKFLSFLHAVYICDQVVANLRDMRNLINKTAGQTWRPPL